VRAAYAALVLGLASGVWLAGQALSVTEGPATVADALALDPAGVDIDARRSEAVAVLLARCMTEHGLSWTPWVEPTPSVPDPELEPIAWAERWGFGVSTLVGRAVDVRGDPNLVAMDGLRPAEQERYRAAVSGTSPTDVGCQRSATDAVHGLRDRLLAPLRPALTDLDGRIAADPAARRAVDAWRRCALPVADGEVAERPTLGPALVQRFVASMEQLGAAARSVAGLAALQAEERRVAAALARCEAAFSEARADIARSFEKAFVTEHRAELERIGAAIRDAEAALPTLPP
jgi:hypothetical protein